MPGTVHSISKCYRGHREHPTLERLGTFTEYLRRKRFPRENLIVPPINDRQTHPPTHFSPHVIGLANGPRKSKSKQAYSSQAHADKLLTLLHAKDEETQYRVRKHIPRER